MIVGARGGPSDIRAARGERLATARGSHRHRRSYGGHTELLPPKAAGRKGYSRIIRFKYANVQFLLDLLAKEYNANAEGVK